MFQSNKASPRPREQRLKDRECSHPSTVERFRAGGRMHPLDWKMWWLLMAPNGGSLGGPFQHDVE